MTIPSATFGHQTFTSKLENRAKAKQVVKPISTMTISREIAMDLVALFEAFVVGICAILATLIYVGSIHLGTQQAWSYYGVGLAGALFSFSIMRLRGHYTPENLQNKSKQTARIFRALALTFLLLFMLGYMFKVSNEYSRGWVVVWLALSFVALSTGRRLVISSLKKLTHSGVFTQQIVLFGADPLCGQLHDHLLESGADVNIVKTFCVKGLSGEGKFMEKAVTAQLHNLVVFGREHKFDQIIVALPANGGARIQEIMLELGQLPVAIDILPSEAALHIKQPKLSRAGDVGFYNMQNKPISGWGSLTKRIFDLAISIPALVILSPFMAIIAAAIKLTSPGKVFFIQERHGLNEEVINVMKFRTMSASESTSSFVQAKKNDARITKIGHILRKTSMDELPQLINVVRGDMSLVGPRPHPLQLNEDHAHLVQMDGILQKLHRYASRHNVKPGITGWAQVKGFRGETDTAEKMIKRVQFDLHYIHNWTIWMDMRILRKTVMAVIKGENAG